MGAIVSVWPETLKVGPLREWPGVLTPASQRRNSSFRSPLPKTLELLDKEVWHLATTQEHIESAELLVAIAPHDFRRDGRPYANAKAEHPGVVFSMDTAMGHVSYPSDLHLTWQENLRAVALTLQALRAVTRYGVTRNGEQYRGSLAIESAQPVHDVASARAVLLDITGRNGEDLNLRDLVRQAKREAHPDTASLAGEGRWHDVVEAERIIREAGLL